MAIFSAVHKIRHKKTFLFFLIFGELGTSSPENRI